MLHAHLHALCPRSIFVVSWHVGLYAFASLMSMKLCCLLLPTAEHGAWMCMELPNKWLCASAFFEPLIWAQGFRQGQEQEKVAAPASIMQNDEVPWLGIAGWQRIGGFANMESGGDPAMGSEMIRVRLCIHLRSFASVLDLAIFQHLSTL